MCTRVVDRFGQVIDVFMSQRHDAQAARRCFEQAIGTTEVDRPRSTDRGCHRSAATYPPVLDDLLPAAWHRTQQHANNHFETDQAA